MVDAVGVSIAAGDVGRFALGPLGRGVHYSYLVLGLFESAGTDATVDIQASVVERARPVPSAGDVNGGRQLFRAPGGVIGHRVNPNGGSSFPVQYLPVAIGEAAGKYVLVEIDPVAAGTAVDGWISVA